MIYGTIGMNALSAIGAKVWAADSAPLRIAEPIPLPLTAPGLSGKL